MEKNILAIIPARGGSKSIPKKNIKLLGNKPLIAYPIKTAKDVKLVNKIVVSTDSEEIAAVAREQGAEVPFIRPSELSDDQTATLPVLQHCVQELEKTGYKADIVVLLYPTSPFLSAKDVKGALQEMLRAGKNSVISVEEDWGRFWRLDEASGRYKSFYPEQRVNRQYYKPLLRENGAIYFSTYEVIMTKDLLVDGDSICFYKMPPDSVVDIDEPHDWEKAEAYLREQHGTD